MRHFVNLSLLFFFVTLVASGLLRFFKPFDLVVTRVHIAFGFGTLVMVALHLSSRGKYFVGLLRRPRKKQASTKHPIVLLGSVFVAWVFLLVASLWNQWPVDVLVSRSYEARHAKEIFRDHPKTAYESIESGLRVKRVTDSEASIRLELEWGESFAWRPGVGQPLSGSYPQIAIWAETEDGTVLESLYVSQACATGEEFQWNGHPQTRESVLPVWYSRYKSILGREPEEEVDGTSGATPLRDFSMEGYLTMDAQPFSVYVEVNAPGDVNEFFHNEQATDREGYSPAGIGQPSVIYEAFVFPDDSRRYYLLELSSHSRVASADEVELIYELDKLTTAKQIIEKILLHVTWPPKLSEDAEEPI